MGPRILESQHSPGEATNGKEWKSLMNRPPLQIKRWCPFLFHIQVPGLGATLDTRSYAWYSVPYGRRSFYSQSLKVWL